MTDVPPAHGDEKNGGSYWSLIPAWHFGLCVLLGVIGLLGLADLIVNWRPWMETTWMAGWRAVSALVFAPIASFIPDGAASAMLAYIVLGAAVARVFLAGALAYPAQTPEREGKDLDSLGVTAAGAALALVWPVVWLHVLWSFSRGGNVHHRRSYGNRYFAMRQNYTDDGKRSRKATAALIGKFTLLTFCLFAPLVFFGGEISLPAS
ncbi:MAG: hypothetical protein ACFB0F_01810 [Neomegalonema sp.]